MRRRTLTIISLVFAISNAIVFVILDFNEILGLIFLVWALATLILNNETWAAGLRKNLGIAILGGLTVSFFRDITVGNFSDLTKMYFILLAFSILLLVESASEREDI